MSKIQYNIQAVHADKRDSNKRINKARYFDKR